MFVQALATAIGAGLASAVLFVVATKGTMFAAFLTAFAPLPVMIAALGWTHWAGLLAALIGALALSLFLPAPPAIAYFVALALPGWLLARLTLLCDPPPEVEAAPGERAWYPHVRLVSWAAAIGAAVAFAWTIALMAITGAGLDYDQAVRTAATRMAEVVTMVAGRGGLPRGVEPAQLAEALVRAAPGAAAFSTTVMNLVNLWLAGRIVDASGRLARPRLAVAIDYATPRAMIAVLAAGLIVAFLGGLAGALGWIAASVAFAVYVLQGLATLHLVTRDWPQRRTALLSLYALLVFFGWLIALIGLVGLADALFGLRRRYLASSPPPTI